MNIYVVRLNPDTRECSPYSKYPSEREYKQIHSSSPMDGFHEAANFLSESGCVKGYLPPRHSSRMRSKKPFILITITAKSADINGDQVVGIQAGCRYVGETERTGGALNIKNLGLTYHYTCASSLSLVFDKPLNDARSLVLEEGRKWYRGPTYELTKKKTAINIIKKAIAENCVKKSIRKLKQILNILKGKTKGIKKEIAGDSTFEDELNVFLSKKNLENVKGNKAPEQKEVMTYQHIRDPKVAAFALLAANGICHDCKKPGPFISERTKMPFLEVHHVVQLKDNGSDTTDNVIALCPNCHRKRHYV